MLNRLENKGTRRMLSAQETALWKVLFPAAIILGCLTFTLIFLLLPGPPISVLLNYFLVAVTVIATASVLLMTAPLKYVSRDDANLYIQSRQGEIAIPLDTIAQVREDSWARFGDKSPIIVEFKHPTEAGKKIRFIPHGQAVKPASWKDPVHPLVEELRQAAGLGD